MILVSKSMLMKNLMLMLTDSFEFRLRILPTHKFLEDTMTT